MDKTIIEQWKKAAFELAPSIKEKQKSDAPNLYTYMVYSSFTLLELYFTAIDSIDKNDFQFSTKNMFYANMKRLSKLQMKSLYVFFMLDYFAFLKFEMHPKFYDSFPATYEEIWEGFKKSFDNFPNELDKIDEVINNYELAYHPRTFLRRAGLPEHQEDLLLLETLNELKFELFHQFNKNVIRYVKNTSFKFK